MVIPGSLSDGLSEENRFGTVYPVGFCQRPKSVMFEVVAIIVKGCLIQQGGTNGIGRVYYTGPGRNSHDRPGGGIRAASPQWGDISLTGIIVDQRSHQGQFAPDLVIDPEVLLAVEDGLISCGVVQIVGLVGCGEEAGG